MSGGVWLPPPAACVVPVHGRADERALVLGERAAAHGHGLQMRVAAAAAEARRSVVRAAVSHAPRPHLSRSPSRPGARALHPRPATSAILDPSAMEVVVRGA